MSRVQISLGHLQGRVPTATPQSRMRAVAPTPTRGGVPALRRRSHHRHRTTPCAAQSPSVDEPELKPAAAVQDAISASKDALSSSSDEIKGTAAAASNAISSAATDAAQRLRELSAAASEDRPYAAPNALSLARQRALQKWLPYAWAERVRGVLEEIPEQQFSYLQSTVTILGVALTTFGAAYAAWPVVHDGVLWAFAAGTPEARNMQEMTFETQYLAAVSLLTAILLGNSFGMCFNRQAQLVQEMGEEVLALELLLQELFIEIPEPHLRARVIEHIRSYIDNEMQAQHVDSPFSTKGSIVKLFDALLTLKSQEGRPIGKLVECVEMLARANSRRGGIAASTLPSLHWVMLGSLTCLVLAAFILFDSDFNNNIEENHRTFSVIAATFATILAVLMDIADPNDGIYSCRDPLESRLSYVRWQMDNILSDPMIKVSMLDNGSEEEAASESEGGEGSAEEPAADENGSEGTTSVKKTS